MTFTANNILSSNTDVFIIVLSFNMSTCDPPISVFTPVFLTIPYASPALIVYIQREHIYYIYSIYIIYIEHTYCI